jgi:hypothetical protein
LIWACFETSFYLQSILYFLRLFFLLSLLPLYCLY